MQKLVTIYLEGNSSDIGVREHLTDFLGDGWKVVSMVAVGASVGVGNTERASQKVQGWLAVLLEK